MIEGIDRVFKLQVVKNVGRWVPDSYRLWIDDIFPEDLPDAPPVKKEDIPTVCQSENFEYFGEVTTRITFNVFLEGILCPIVAEHNRRSLYTFLEVDGKVEKYWEGITLDKLAEQPYTFYLNGRKFVLRWVVQLEDSDDVDRFELQVDGDPLAKLFYLNLDFQLIEKEVEVHNGCLIINDKGITESVHGEFSWRPTILSHELLRVLED